MKKRYKMNILTIGTKQKGGIDSVIQGYIDDGLYANYGHYRIASHGGESKCKDLFLFICSVIRFIYLCIHLDDVIVHSHMSYKGSFWRKYIFLNIARKFKHKTIIHLHGSEFKVYFESRGPKVKKLIVQLINYADEFVVLSKCWADYLKEISGKNVIVINNYVDIKPKVINRCNNKILFLGAFIPRKGIYDLIYAFSKLEGKYELHLCGRGEDHKVEKLVEDLNVKNNVIFHGWVDFEKKNELLSECSVMILPSYNEGLPMVIIESMGCEIPIITTPVGAIPEVIVENETGFLVEPGDIDAMILKLNLVMKSADNNRILCENAKALYKEKFNSKVILPLWHSLYCKL